MTDNFVSAVAEPATARLDWKQTEVGSVFVSNYPPYSFWSAGNVGRAQRTFDEPSQPNAPLGLYLHIPFCRKRCKFCYFRVYTDKNSTEIQTYLDALASEVEVLSTMAGVANRPLKFVYFGGGTPSYISAKHLRALVRRVKAAIPWDGAEEITFECEPGTLTQTKLAAIRKIGVTRLSLGIENFNDEILQENGRAHLSEEIYRCLPWIKELAFDQLNIDLIAGMVGETWETWRDTVHKTIAADPDSVTIYQMELPFNTVYSKSILSEGRNLPVADWNLKREWHAFAIAELENAGYVLSSAYTMVKSNKRCEFVYRNSVWQGCDLLGTGVASFGHLSGVHYQNTANWNEYIESLTIGNLPLARAFVPTQEEKMTRELILQMKLGRVTSDYFKQKFGADIIKAFRSELEELQRESMLNFNNNEIALTPQGLLRVDQLLPAFYDTKYRNARYT